ncbi:MAG: hypothetical protein ACQCN5_13070 [Candidatus Bathyarchaeia archaeon]|jgi:hypothetical protein
MKLYLKIAVLLFIASLLSTVSVVYAEGITDINTASPTTQNLNSVAIVSAANSPTLLNSKAWAVGDNGTIISWDGTKWSSVVSPTTTNLYAIVMISENAGLAVGGNSTSGIILQYKDGTWSVMSTSSPINGALYGVTAGSNGSPAWAVGANGLILNWNGAQWTQQTSPTTKTLRSVAMVHDSNNVWAVGDNGTIIQYNGSNWVTVTSPTASNLKSIVMLNSTSGWAVGGTGNTGVIINMNASTWNTFARINFGGIVNTTTGYVADRINATLNSLSIDTSTSAWAAGAAGTTLYWGGTDWMGQVGVLGGVNINSIAAVHGVKSDVDLQTSYAWAVGDGGKILAWTGVSWIPEFPIVVLPVILSAIALAAYIGKVRLGKRLQI